VAWEKHHRFAKPFHSSAAVAMPFTKPEIRIPVTSSQRKVTRGGAHKWLLSLLRRSTEGAVEQTHGMAGFVDTV
jgi:hypothetical protein